MRLLWIPHTHWFQRVGHRAEYIIDQLREEHEVHVVTWSEPESSSVWHFADPTIHIRALLPWELEEDGIYVHHVPRWCLHRLPHLWKRNQRFLQEKFREIVQKYAIETAVMGPSAYLIGYPPVDTGARLIFDYVDYTEDQRLMEYLKRANTIVCASRFLQRQVESLGRRAHYLPNGVDFGRLQNADGKRIREQFGFEGKLVISLIGLTCSPDFYFARSLFRLSAKFPNIRYLFVGKGPLYSSLRHALRKLNDKCVWTGWIPKEAVYDFFLASDIGLYPGADTAYFRAACPIKILEYAAAGKPVVSSRVEEVSHLRLTNVLQATASAEGFYDGITQVQAGLTTDFTSYSIPDWSEIGKRFAGILAR